MIAILKNLKRYKVAEDWDGKRGLTVNKYEKTFLSDGTVLKVD